MAKVVKKKKNQKSEPKFGVSFTKENYIFLGIGVLILIIGFLLMSQGPWDNPVSLTISPIVLLVAYLVIFPISILYRRKSKVTEDDSSQS